MILFVCMKKIIVWLLILTALILSSCGSSSSVDIINPDAEYQYFFGATCPHCQELNEAVKSEDLFSKIAVEKKEVYYNDANRDAFLALTKELGLTKKETGVPFVYDKISGKHAVGVGPALELFKSRLGATAVSWSGQTQVPETSSGTAQTVSEAPDTASGTVQTSSGTDEISTPVNN